MRYLFEDCALDTDARELCRGTSSVPVEPQVFDLLVYLIRNRDRVVSKDDLIASIWHGRIVSESTLNTRISAARFVIGDNGEDQRLIKTWPRKGIRFVGMVREQQRSPYGGTGIPLSERMPDEVATPAKPRLGPPADRVPEHAPEHRLLTIMVCSLVGLPALAARLDPEDLHEVIAAHYRCVRHVVERHGGLVAKRLAEGVLAYFGYPQAHEDDAERAVRAGLAAIRAVGELKTEVLPEGLQARVGIATGLVVIGDVTGNGQALEHALAGETPLLAAQLLTLAAPGAVVMSNRTRRLVGGLFECRDLGAGPLKGIDGPVDASVVLGESAVTSRFEALHGSDTSPLLGRDEELELLLRRWEQAKRGEGRVVLLTGEAGIGKSRLARALQECLRSDPHTLLGYHCSPHYQDSALHPVIAQLMQAADMERGDPADAKIEKLEAMLGQSSTKLAEDIPLLAALLSIPGGTRYPVPSVTPQRLKDLTLRTLIEQLAGLAERHPVLMTIEDLHWVDPTTLELLLLTVTEIERRRVLIVATARPEFAPPWPSYRHVSTLVLTRLDRRESEALVSGVTKGKRLPAEVLDQIMTRTDGVPLFVEELTKTVLESGLLREAGDGYELIGRLAPFAIPSTLHASLLARLDRFASVKDAAQIAAAIGRQFSYGLISAVSALPERDLRAALAELVGAELVFQRGTPPDATYLFKHALVQEAAYASLVRSHRQQLHGQIARVLKEQHPDIVAAEPEILAHHFTEAGLVETAIPYWRRAGDHSLSRSAYKEAVNRLTRAIEMLRSKPETTATLEEELEIRLRMVPALIAAKGAGSSEVEALYLRAQELVERLGKASLRFRVLWGLWFVKYCRGQYAAAREAGQRLLDVSRTLRDTGQILEAHHAMWALLSAKGDFEEAVRHMEQGMAAYEREPRRSRAFYAGHDPGACARYHLAKDLWLLGHLDRSRSALDDALRLAEELKHPMTSALTLWFAAWLHYHWGNRAGMRASLARLVTLTTEHGISGTREFASVLLDAEKPGLDSKKLSELHNRLQAGQWTSWQLVFCLCFLAARCRETAHVEDGLALLASISAEDREGFYAPEIYRLEGELRRQLPSPNLAEIERCFGEALDLARQRSARSLELRAATSLARLWLEQGRHAEARDLLTPVYSWFSEGLDLPDLQQAHTLLNDLVDLA